METNQPPAIMSFLPIALIIGIFYFLLIRPQQKQAKEHKIMLEALAKGDRIVTTGGIFGEIMAVKGQELEIKIADSVKITVLRSAVASRITDGGIPSSEISPK